MRDRAHQIADRTQVRNDRQQQERREPLWRRGTGEPMTVTDEWRLSAGQAAAYERGHDGRDQ